MSKEDKVEQVLNHMRMALMMVEEKDLDTIINQMAEEMDKMEDAREDTDG